MTFLKKALKYGFYAFVLVSVAYLLAKKQEGPAERAGEKIDEGVRNLGRVLRAVG